MKRFLVVSLSVISHYVTLWCLQCFEGVGWVTGRATGL